MSAKPEPEELVAPFQVRLPGGKLLKLGGYVGEHGPIVAMSINADDGSAFMAIQMSPAQAKAIGGKMIETGGATSSEGYRRRNEEREKGMGK